MRTAGDGRPPRGYPASSTELRAAVNHWNMWRDEKPFAPKAFTGPGAFRRRLAIWRGGPILSACISSRGIKVPAGAEWIHEIKYETEGVYSQMRGF